MHAGLIDYQTTNNGVSEGGDFYICKDCFFIIETYFHIGFEDNVINLSLVESISEEDLNDIAIALLMDNHVHILNENFKDKEKIRVYRYADIWNSASIKIRTSEEDKKYSLEALQNFAMNLSKYIEHSTLYLSLEELFRSKGSRDQYYENTYIISLELSPEDLIIKANSSEYSSSKVRITTSKDFLPEDILLFDIENNTCTPINNLTINDFFNRNHATYLKLLNEKAEQHNNTNKFNNIVQQKVTELRSLLSICL
jgi:hypothetical protein